eukprot:gene11516-15426_t
MSGSKEVLINKLLGPNHNPANSPPLIVDLDDKNKVHQEKKSPEIVTPNYEAEGPTLLELMMAEQQVAAGAIKQEEAKRTTEASNKAFGGFQKGFFGKGSNTNKTTLPSSASKSTTGVKATTKTSPDDIITVTKKNGTNKKSNLVINEVQQIMTEDQNKMLKELKSSEWITPDLMTLFNSNPVLSAGFANPKCMAAMQWMQQNPGEAMKKFKEDPEVSVFLKEFGAVMGKHFDRLAEEKAKTTQGNSSNIPESKSKISELSEDYKKITITDTMPDVGPLHAQVLERQRTGAKSTNEATVEVLLTKEEEDAKIKKILDDQELRDMLMDPALQAILLECNDPMKYQHHMRDPIISRKIRRLLESGLLATAR